MGTHYQGTAEEQAALSAYINLSRASESLHARIHRHLRGAEISLAEFSVLELLLHLGPQRQNVIADKVLRTRGSITQVIDQLESRMLVSRNRESEDRRCYTVQLTVAGRKVIRPIFERHAAIVCKEMSKLSKKEQEDLRCLCRKLGREDSESGD